MAAALKSVCGVWGVGWSKLLQCHTKSHFVSLIAAGWGQQGRSGVTDGRMSAEPLHTMWHPGSGASPCPEHRPSCYFSSRWIFGSRGCPESVWDSVFIYIPMLQRFILCRACPPGAWANADLWEGNKRRINHFLNEESKLIFSSQTKKDPAIPNKKGLWQWFLA